MESFDINKEMAKLKGLNIIEKCSPTQTICDELEDARKGSPPGMRFRKYANVFKRSSAGGASLW